MSNSAILGFPLVDPNQNQKEDTIDTGLSTLEAAGEDIIVVDLSAGAVTLTATQWTTAKVYKLNGATVARTVTVPATKRFVVFWNSGAFPITVQVVGGAGRKLIIPPAGLTAAYCTGPDFWALSGVVEARTIVIGDETTAITTGTAKVTFRMPYAFTITDLRASLSTAQATGSIFTVDVKEAGVTILSTLLTIDNTEKTTTTAVTPAVISDASLADDAEITVDVTQVGDGTAKGLKITLIGYRT